MCFKRKKKLKEVNGFKIRPAKGSCPHCAVREDEQCRWGCVLLDPLREGKM